MTMIYIKNIKLFDPYKLSNMTLFSKGNSKSFYRYIKMIKKYKKKNILCYAGNPYLIPNFDGYDKTKIYSVKDYIPVIVLDTNGTVVCYSNDYRINCEGDVIRICNLKKGKEKITDMVGDCTNRVNLSINGTPQKILRHHLQVWSFFPKFDWRNFMKNKGNLGKKDAEVDHIKGNHEKCHINFLEIVTQEQNKVRATLVPHSDIMKENRSKTLGIPLHAFKNDEPILDENNKIISYYSSSHCASMLFDGNETIRRKISKILENNGTDTELIFKEKKYTFVKTNEYNHTQTLKEIKDYCLENNVLVKKINHVYCEKFILVDKLEIERKEKMGSNLPYSISNFSRLKDVNGRIWNGNINVEGVPYYKSTPIHQLVMFAFAPLDDVKKFGTTGYDKVCHMDGDGDKYHELVLENNMKTNIYGTMYFGDSVTNGNDLRGKNNRLKQEDKTNAFKVWDNNNVELNKIFYHVPSFIEEANMVYSINFSIGAIYSVLNGDRPHHWNFKFVYIKTK